MGYKNYTKVLLLLLYGCAPTTVVAGYYETVEGEKTEVCKVYFEYLKTQKAPLICQRDFPPENTQLQRPAWQQLDINKNKLLILRIENYLQIPRDENATQPWSPLWSENDLANYDVTKPGRSLHKAVLDIDNDGKKEVVVKYRSYTCHEWDYSARAPSWRAPIVVMEEARQMVDIEQTYLLMQNRDKRYLTNYDEIQLIRKERSRQRKVRKLEIARREKGS